MAAGDAQLLQSRGQSALGDIVHGAGQAVGGRQTRFRHDADAIEKPLAGVDFPPGKALGQEPGVKLARHNGGPLHGHGFGHQHAVARPHPFFLDQIRFAHRAGHHADHHRPVDGVADFGVAAAQGDIPLPARFGQLMHDQADPRRGGAPRQQQGGQKPARQGPGRDDVVGVDQHRVLADRIGGEGYGVRFENQHFAVGHIDGGGVFADPRADQNGRVREIEGFQVGAQGVVGQLARPQRQAFADQAPQLVQPGDAKVAGRRPQSGVVVGVEQHGHSAGGPAGLHIEQVIAHHQNLLRDHPPLARHPLDAVLFGLGRMAVVAADDQVEIAGPDQPEIFQGPEHGRPAVAR